MIGFGLVQSQVDYLGARLEKMRHTTLPGADLKAMTTIETNCSEGLDWVISRRQYSGSERTEIQFQSKKFTGEHVSPARFTYEVTDCVAYKTGSIMRHGLLIDESTSWPAYRAIISLNKVRRRKPSATSGDSSVILAQNSYYHWLIEDLPSFLFTISAGSAVEVWTHSQPPGFVSSFVESYLEVPPKLFRGSVHLEKAIFTGKSGIIGFPQTRDIQILRQFFAVADRPRELGRVIYVSRRGSSRSPQNEPILEEKLESVGVKVVNCEGMSLPDQVKLFGEASLVIGLHGAGLTNVVFMPQGKVLELTRKSKRNGCFGFLATKCGHDYTEYAVSENLSAQDIETIARFAVGEISFS